MSLNLRLLEVYEMLRVKKITNNVKKNLLHFLYQDELFNVFMIHFLENQIKDLGELYLLKEQEQIKAILHLKFDGNSYFTNFYTPNSKYLKRIAIKIKQLNYPKILLAGKMNDIQQIMKYLNLNKEIKPNIYYKYDENQVTSFTASANFRRATLNDLPHIHPFLIDFFEVSSAAEIKDITNRNKLIEDLKVGIYVLEKDDKIIGMARFSSFTNHHADITTVYIDPHYREQGYGKLMMKRMIDTALNNDKIPVTQTSIYHSAARKIYESLGFIKQDNYAFEFIS